MALVTRCPKCSTMFRVVPDQLRVSAGWVRCGHCHEVFDAAQHMLPRGSELAALGEAPEVREAPEAPEVPEAPDVPKAPEAPQAPQTPKAPEVRAEREEREEHAARETEGALTNSASLLQRREGTQQPSQLPTPDADAVGAPPSRPPAPPSQPPAQAR